MGSSIFPSDSMIQSIKSTLFKAAKPSDLFDPENKSSSTFDYSGKFAHNPSGGIFGQKENETAGAAAQLTASIQNAANSFQNLV